MASSSLILTDTVYAVYSGHNGLIVINPQGKSPMAVLTQLVGLLGK